MPLQFPALIGEFDNAQKFSTVHSSRTIMLAELQLLLSACEKDANLAEYKEAAIQENVLLKRTAYTRQKTFNRLRDLYLLDNTTLLYRALRDLWDDTQDAQPMLALLCAVSQDAILYATAEFILALPVGTPVTPDMLAELVDQRYPNYYNATSLQSIGRNAISSWKQAGLLAGKLHKTRIQGKSYPSSLAYALLLGHLSGARGEALFQTLWCRLLDSPSHLLQEQAALASQHGWIEYRHMGQITEIGFRYLLRK